MKKHDLHNAQSLPVNLAFAGLSMAASLACAGVWAQAAAGPAERPVGKPAGTVGAVEERPVPSAAPAAAATADRWDDSYKMNASKRSDSKVSRPEPTVRTSTASASAASAASTKPASTAASAAAASAARPKASGVPSKPAP